jgi:hypothetical protein
MRGIERVIAGILLLVAVCGSAAFARSVGRDAVAGDEAGVQLVAAPPQHARSPHGVQVPLYPLLTDRPTLTPAKVAAKPAAKPSLADVPALTISAPLATRRVVVARSAPRSSPPAAAPRPARPAPKPVVRQHRPVQAPPAPTPQPESESRILAKVPLTPTPTWQHVKAVGHGRLKNHPDDDGSAAPAQQQPQPPPPAPQPNTITIVVLTPAPPAASGPAGGPGNGNGHAYGHLKHGLNVDD